MYVHLSSTKAMKHFYSLIAFFCFGFSVFAQEPDTSKQVIDSLDLPSKVPVFSVNASDVDNDLESQDVSSLLQSSRDVFTSMAGFNLSAGRFRMRGLGSENQIVMINGVPFNNPETGFASFSTWGGLNDVTRFTEVRNGINSCRFHFGNVGGYTNIESKASSFKKGVKFSYSIANRAYRHRAMFTQSTGLNQKGWAITYSLSARVANEGYFPGTYFSSLGYYLGVDKKINDKHMLSFVGFGAPIVQARQGFAVKEAYELSGEDFYNPNWGYQTSGDERVVRNARVSSNHKPTALLTHYFTIDENSKLTTTAFFSVGMNSLSNLNWYDTKDPRPDYYRYLPSYYEFSNPSYARELTDLWANDVNTRQINWDALYNANYNNLYTLENVDGTGQDLTGKRSKYIVENVHTNSIEYGLNAVYNKRIDRIFLTGGLNTSIYKGLHFKTIDDLLGGDFWVDVDQFAEQSFADPTVSQNDLNNINHAVYKGDKFGFDYVVNVNNVAAFGQAEYSISKFDMYVGLTAGSNSVWRTGNFQNGRFPNNSKGDSEKANFFTYGIKGGVTYKITGRHFVSVNGTIMQRPPDSRSIFQSVRTNNTFVTGLTEENVVNGDINYIIRYPRFKARVTGYYTTIKNQIWYRSYYHDEYRNIVNYVLNGVDHKMIGTELGMEATIIDGIIFQAGFSHGQYLWDSRPTATITRDNSAELLDENRTVYMKNYHIGNMPETVGSFGFKINGKKFWYAGINFNVFANYYTEANPDRRTEEALDIFVVDDPQWNQLLDQEKLPTNQTVDIYGGKSFQIQRKYYLNVNLSINNVLNNTSLVNNAVEQLRYDNLNPNKFPNKYAYAMGLNYFLIISFRF